MEMDKTTLLQETVRETSMPLFKSKGWIRLLGILMLIYGIMIALSLVGLIIAWLPIWLGILLIQTSNRIGQAQITGDKYSLTTAMQSLGTYFTIYGVLTLIGLIMGVVAMTVMFTTGMLTQLEEFSRDYY